MKKTKKRIDWSNIENIRFRDERNKIVEVNIYTANRKFFREFPVQVVYRDKNGKLNSLQYPYSGQYLFKKWYEVHELDIINKENI